MDTENDGPWERYVLLFKYGLFEHLYEEKSMDVLLLTVILK